MALLDASGLRKSYGDTPAVDGVSLCVERGEVLGLLGPNGAGKTTTMMMISGLLPADDGEVRINGRELSVGDASLRGALGIVPQDLAVYPALTARENLEFFGGVYGLRGAHLKGRVDAVVELTGLTDFRDRIVGTYSGGMKRRLNLGIALVHEPELLILDEPTVGVDPQSRAHILTQIKELSRGGLGVIYASHYMEEVQTVSDRVAIMDNGRIVACDTLDALLRESGAVVEPVKSPESNLERLFLELTGHHLRD
jgi:linearmycin/streptolysin S transport system ATP-binding protein